MLGGLFSLHNWQMFADQIDRYYGIRLSVSPIDSWFSKLNDCYDQPWRYFHNQKRVGTLLQLLNGRARKIALDSLSMKMAIWFHSAEFTPGKDNNERNSMTLFQQFATEISLPPAFTALTCCLILAPTTETAKTADGILFTDMLNLYLGDTWENFCLAQDMIRQEHATCEFSSKSEYRKQTLTKLRKLIGQDRIFSKDIFWNDHEAQARKNISQWLEGAST